ncbi:MAG: 5'-nucleotidase C-terminal domain-containing protein [Candidatus Acidiferrales bacterium]
MNFSRLSCPRRFLPRSILSLLVVAPVAVVIAMGVAVAPAASRAQMSASTSSSSAGAPPATVDLTLLGTTDLHGHIEPLDYYTNKPANLGLAKIATLIRQVRAERPNVLLLDSGDTIQGTPLAYYYATKDTNAPNPMTLLMNSLGYEAAAAGNHEFNFGLNVLWKMKREANFPILAANLEQEYKSGVPYFRPYIIKVIAGVRVGIVGFVTPAVPNWEIPANYRGYKFLPIVETARRVIPEVRRQADLVVVITHSGLGPDPATGASAGSDEIAGENTTLALAEQVPGIDVIMFGHTHREVKQMMVNGALLVQAKNWGGSLAQVDVEMTRDAQGHWRVASKRSTTLTAGPDVPPDPEIMRMAAPYEAATQKYLDTPIATCDRDLSGATERFEEGPLVDLIHRVQLDAGHADVSLATMFYTDARIPAGRVTVRQIAALYVYENTLYVVRMTGAQLRAALEHAASFFQLWPLPAGETLKLPDYSADSAAGVSYKIDLTRPAGDRIVDLTFHGQPLDPKQTLRVAINNYRYTGGGLYTMFRGLPILYRSPVEIRELIIDYVSRHGAIPTNANHTWEIIPPDAVAAMRALAERRSDASSTLFPALPGRHSRALAAAR